MPVEKWGSLSNEEKRHFGITKGGGVSILRCGREIDFGWHFMGKKRKENYDDWWRCEIEFEPALDEWFGVSNTKQGIRPSEKLLSILSPDMERIAYLLNRRVQNRFASIKDMNARRPSTVRATDRDCFLEPPESIRPNSKSPKRGHHIVRERDLSHYLKGLTYKIERSRGIERSFFSPALVNNEIVVSLCEDHPFYSRVYATIQSERKSENDGFLDVLKLVILAFARAEVVSDVCATHAKSLREEWSKVLASFLD